MTKSLLPSLLGRVVHVFMGPAVNCVGCGSVLWKNADSPRIAQTLTLSPAVSPCEELNRKYFPSGVQMPSRSEEGVLQPGSKGRRLVPSDLTSHKDCELLLGSNTVKRNTCPSGDQRIWDGCPPTVTSLRESVPSLLARNKSAALA